MVASIHPHRSCLAEELVAEELVAEELVAAGGEEGPGVEGEVGLIGKPSQGQVAHSTKKTDSSRHPELQRLPHLDGPPGTIRVKQLLLS